MPKLKTLKSAIKRFKKTANYFFKHKKANLRHILTKKKQNYKRNLRSKVLISSADHKRVLSFFPYG